MSGLRRVDPGRGHPVPAVPGAATASPVTVGTTGVRHFGIDERGATYASSTAPFRTADGRLVSPADAERVR